MSVHGRIKYFALLIFLNVQFSSTLNVLPYKSQPRFSTINGHLHIISAADRNITFRTSGGGQVNLNDENLLQIVRKARNAHQFLEVFKMYELPDIREKLVRYSEYLEGTHGLVQKMARIEVGSLNGTSFTGIVNGTSRPTFHTIPNLERTVRKLTRDVVRLKRLLQADECSSNPCRNGGTCRDLFNGFQCDCPSAWEGLLCDADVDECAVLANTHLGCLNGGSCVNKPGFYECVCTSGFYGVRCTESTTSCTTRGDELCAHGICVPHKNSFKCICDQGWTTDGTSPACVVDVNECEGHFSCSKSPPVDCRNTLGSYSCGSCPPGYTGNGHYCNDIDECLINNGGCSLVPSVLCFNLPGSAVCAPCPPGYSGDGSTCQFLGGPCFVDNGGCHPKATCIQNLAISASYVQCVCPPGYDGAGIGPTGCTPSATATSNFTSCPSSRCSNHGTCTYQVSEFNFKCNCDTGYTGTFCEITEDPCSPNPCLNGGTCSRVESEPLQFECHCPSAFIGHFCQMEQEVCRGVFTTPHGVLSFPEMPNATYPHDSNCAWIIKTNISLVLNVSFDIFALEKSIDCKVDWLQINDGPDTTHNLIGRYCGSTKPKNFTSSSNSIHVWFRSDRTTSMAGFRLQWTSVEPKCGGTIKDVTHGSISSPGSPRRYPINRNCYWHIQVPKGYKILFTFYTLMIGTSANCTKDYLEIINGYDDFDEPMERICGANYPPPFYSTASSAVLHFYSDNITGADEVGFQLTYAAIRSCGGLLSAFAGIITSPKHPEKSDEYISDSVCEWTIQLPPNERVVLNFVSFDLEDSDNCTYDNVEIFDGPSIESPLLGKFCGSKKTILPIISTKNQVSIRFSTDLTNSGSGFRIKYDLLCGGEFTADSGHFNSPLFPNYYPNEKRCLYLLSQPPGKAIEVKFVEFEMESSSDACELDFLKAYDGENENATLIGTYCSGNRPETIISKHNYLFFVFETDSTISKKGFYANFTVIDVACGGIFKANSSTITSPKHPSTYPTGQKCQWVISAPPGYFIQLTWTEFSLEMHSQCLHDYVEIYDNSSLVAQDVTIGRFCGFKLPPPVTSTGNIMTISFVSDATISMDGFSANYLMLDGTRMCGGNYFSTTGYIRTPNYPGRYPYNRNCIWTITVPPGQQIKLHVKNFTLEPNKFCHYDYLEIRQGGYETSPLIGKYCGYTSPPNITSHGNQLFMKFVSDATTNMEGFNIYWDGTSTGCGGVLTSATGSITSPNYPNSYSSNSNCVWKITVNKGSVIKLNIVDVDLDSMYPGKCWANFLSIYDGHSAKSPLLGSFCRNGQQTVLTSTKNEMFIKFRFTRRFESGKGFFLQYSSVCNVTLTGFTGVIESPNFPETYPRQTNCLWVIQAPLGNRINVSFSHFDLEGGRGFPFDEFVSVRAFWPASARLGLVMDRNSSDFVEIKEGASAYDSEVLPPTSLGIFRGRNMTKMISSTQDHVYVHFRSLDIFPGTGFRLEWTVHGCGGMFLNRPRGKFSTPNYPNYYPPKIQCDWYITADWDKQITITIPRIDIEDDDNKCEMDSLTIYSGEDDTAPILTRICQSQSTTVIVNSHGNKAFIRFLSDMSFSGRGFEASFITDKGGCGGLFKTVSGSIFSPGYPKNYKEAEECTWLIVVKPNHMVNLTFSDFDVGVSRLNANCSLSYVDIFDGFFLSGRKLARLCGNTLPKPFISTTNELMVRLRARSPTSKGFAANYTTACGAVIETDDSGVISSDTAIIANQESSECTWIIRAKKPESKITFLVTHMNINNDRYAEAGDCEDNGLHIYDGDDTNATKILNACGTALPPPVTSSGSSMLITFKLLGYRTFVSKHMYKFSGFYSVRSTVCGGSLTSEHGTISSPSYPNSYPRMTDCVWTISASPGNKMQLAFSTFSLVKSDNCNEDYVEIRESGVAGKLLSVSCGDSKPELITANHAIWVKFHSGSQADTTGKGFTADFDILNENELSASSGTITSPLFPLVYTFDKAFTWRIIVQPQQSIMITFNECSLEQSLPGEIHPLEDMDDISCISELKIYDGFDETAPLLGKICGFTCPKPIITSSSYAFVAFYNTLLFTGSSFSLSWSEVPRKYDSFLGKSSSNSSCDEDVFLSTSPTGNLTYTYNRSLSILDPTCTFIVRSDKGSHIVLKFEKMNLYRSIAIFGCRNSISVYEGTPSNEWKLVKNMCAHSENTGTTIEGTNLMKMEVTLQRLWDLNSNGLVVTASLVCGGVMGGPNGVLEVGERTKLIQEQPKPFAYHNHCEWSIIVKPGRTIKFSYPDIFDLSSSSSRTKNVKDCDRAYVMIKNGQDDDYPPLGNGKYCNSTVVSIPETSGNKAFVRFVTASSEAVGLKLAYHEVSLDCNGEFLLSESSKSVNISSPEYPNAPPPHSECVWKFSAPPHESIRITFPEQFDFTFSTGCKDDYIEIRDGLTEVSRVIGRFCDSMRVPNSLFSTGNQLLVKYFTDVRNPKNGFLATVDLASCGGTYTTFYGKEKITSPGYPNSYSPNQNCNTTLVTGQESYFQLNFSSVNLLHLDGKMDFSDKKSNSSCTSNGIDLVVVYNVDPITFHKTELARACRHFAPPPFESTSNKVLITFTSRSSSYAPDSDTLHAGFVLDYQVTFSSCDGVMSTPYGNISSPNYPQKPNKYYHCTWRINAPKGRRVTVTIVKAIFLPPEPTVKPSLPGIERLKFYNDRYYGSRITTLTGAQAAGTKIESSSNFMLISYATNRQINLNRGFLLNFTTTQEAVCGGDLDISGVIESPKTNVSAFYCIWERQNEGTKNKTFVMTVSGIMGPYKRNQCSTYNAVTVFGDSEQILNKFCSNESETVTIRSPFPRTKIKATTSEKDWWITSSYTAVNFTISYTTMNCGGVVGDMNQIISSPNFPEPYDSKSDCAWYLDFGTYVKLTIESVDLESDCKANFLRIYNGKSNEDPLQKEYCGPASNEIIIAHPSTFIEFHSESNVNGKKGFQMRILSTSTGVCSGLLVGMTGQITTPDFPNLYPSLSSCNWEIEVPPGFHVGLSFVDRFYLEDSDNCTKDFLMVYNYGQNKEDETAFEVGKPASQKFCGRVHPPTFNSTYRWMTVRFQSDATNSAEGFKAEWEAICGGVYTEPKGIIFSPHYPESYDSYSNCNYTIFAPGKAISVEFLEFDLEPASPGGCIYHNLTVYSLESQYSMELSAHDVYCGKTLPPKQVFRSVVSLVLRSDDFVQTKGFLIKYEIQGCGGIIMDAPSTISVTRQGILSDVVSRCQWNITAPQGQIVLVQFTELYIKRSPYCYLNSIKLYNGLDHTDDSKEIAQICDENLKIIKSSSNKMCVVFSGYISKDVGFKANILFSLGEQKGCGGRKEVSSSTPLILDFAADDSTLPLSCEWQIFTPADDTLELTFNSVTVASCDNSTTSGFHSCTCNRLSVYDGINTLDQNLITTLCNSSWIPFPLMSSGNSLLIQYVVTQPSITKPKFSIKLERKPSICGPSALNVTNQMGVLTSPGWPQPYQKNVRCIWYLTYKGLSNLDIHGTIDIHITDLDIAPSPQCKNDHLQISEQHITRVPFVYCESKPNASSITDYYSRSGALKIIFVSSGVENSRLVSGALKTYKGFRLEYQISGCNRNYTRDYGQIVINQRGDTDCVIIIKSTNPNATLALYFSLFIMYYGDASCANHKVTVFDGTDSSAKLLRTICQDEKLPNPIFSSGSSLKFHYHTNSSSTLTLDMTYTSTTYGRGCGGYFYSNVGSFSSPLYPEINRSESVCRWQIVVPEGNTVYLSFANFDLGPPSTCSTNNVIIYDVSPTTNEEIFARSYCGQAENSPYRSTSNKLIVESKTNANRAGPGWLINFRAIRGKMGRTSSSTFIDDEY